MLSKLATRPNASLITKPCIKGFSEVLELPVINLSSFINGNTPDINEAKKIVEGLHQYGALAIRDPRVDEAGNQEFLSMMENYYESRSKMHYAG
jgi:hypothetical protein